MSINLNPGLQTVLLYDKFFDRQEVKLHGLIDKLSLTNEEIKIVSKVMNKLAHAKQNNEEADFNNDPEMKDLILTIHKKNPDIFGDLIQGYSEDSENIDMSNITISPLSESKIEIVIQGLDGQLKIYNAELNEGMLHINRVYDDRGKMTEQAIKIVENEKGLKDKINQNMR